MTKSKSKNDSISLTTSSSKKVLFSADQNGDTGSMTTNTNVDDTDSKQFTISENYGKSSPQVYGTSLNDGTPTTPGNSEESRALIKDTTNNMKNGVSSAIADLGEAPKDRYQLVYLIFLINGISTLMPWNMFITAYSYFVDYKLGGQNAEYSLHFSQYLGLCSQVPNLLLNLINAFAHTGGSLSLRIVTSLSILVSMLVLTIVLAMVDSSTWPFGFFVITMVTAIICNGAVGVYQNCVYGMAANFPMRYTSAVILGSNISGTFTSIVNIITLFLSSKDLKIAAICYFTTALAVCLLSFDSYFLLPHCKYYRYHKNLHRVHSSALNMKIGDGIRSYLAPYVLVFKKVWLQMFNIFFLFFVSLSIFPAIQVDVKASDESFIFSGKYYQAITCFLGFNVFAMLGNMVPSWFRNPGPKYLWIFILLRVLMIPYFMFTNYRPLQRTWPVYFSNDSLYTFMGCLNGFTSGYFSALVMMYTPKMVDKGYARIAAMMATFFLIFGIVCGINNSLLIAIVIEKWGPIASNATLTN